MLDCRGLCGYLVCITFAVDKHMPSWPSANMNPWKKLGKYFQDKSGSLTLPKSSADREWERERESKLPMQTYCLKANGNIIMMDRPGFLSSEKRIRTLNGIGTDQYLHWTGSYILLLWRSKKIRVWNPFFRWLQPSLQPQHVCLRFPWTLTVSLHLSHHSASTFSSQQGSRGFFFLEWENTKEKANACYHTSSEQLPMLVCFSTGRMYALWYCAWIKRSAE